MRDPLQNFDWSTLYERYDAMCHGFDPNSPYLHGLEPRPQTDRELYYALVSEFAEARNNRLNEAHRHMLYWKLYSQPAAVANILRRINNDPNLIEEPLKNLLESLPERIDRNLEEITGLIEMPEMAVFGMGTPGTLPVRSTFLHFVYPNAVPVFDKMVLQAVNGNGYVYREGDNHRISIFKQYVPHAWELAERYSGDFPEGPETPVRFIDMALWVVGH